VIRALIPEHPGTRARRLVGLFGATAGDGMVLMLEKQINRS
jgi:hypothetical protein